MFLPGIRGWLAASRSLVPPATGIEWRSHPGEWFRQPDPTAARFGLIASHGRHYLAAGILNGFGSEAQLLALGSSLRRRATQSISMKAV